ncbi:2-dehydro-3-deoxygalactonokinase [bacterium]|nr:MAG: 2-dehydro-3-deoxygalactonokinase [bacterium]
MIAIDWGTSNFRAYRLSSDGRILETRSAPLGISSVEPGQFSAVLGEQISDWLAAEAGPVAMSGMIGSRHGWVEVPYVPCPAGRTEIAAGAHRLTSYEPSPIVICPGLSHRDTAGVPDVMRGEEMQILGAVDECGDGMYCLPGTHTKFVVVEGARIVSFRTFMTGEVFGLLRQHSILARLMDALDDTDDASFEDGVHRARAGGSLLHDLFGVRTRALFGELPTASAASYLSGILVGHEIREASPRGRVTLIASASLSPLYARAFGMFGVECIIPDPEAAVTRGLASVLALLPEENV